MEKFPTLEKLDEARAMYGTGEDFGYAIGIGVGTIREYRKWLLTGHKRVKKCENHYIKDTDINVRIRELIASAGPRATNSGPPINPWMCRVQI